MEISLRHPVLPAASRAEAARRMGIDLEDLSRVLSSLTAAYRDGRVWDYGEFHDTFPDADFYQYTGAAVCPADLLVHKLEVSRDVRRRLAPPITHDEANAIRIISQQMFLEQLEAHDVPSLLIANTCRQIQATYDSPRPSWSPLSQLMTGTPAEAGARSEPLPEYPAPWTSARDASLPVDGAFLGLSLLVQFPFATLVIDSKGALLDAFPTRGTRAVTSDGRYVLLVQGGGGAAQSGYFGAEGFVRDLQARRWLQGAIPSSLSPFVAGTIGDLKWSIVADVSRGAGYPISPCSTSDMCGHTFNSACGNFVWDGGELVLEAATGAPVLDVRELSGDLLAGELLGFANTPDGWRFVMREEPEEDFEFDEEPTNPTPVRLVDERGRCLKVFDENVLATAFSSDGKRYLQFTEDRVETLDASTHRASGRAFDLRPLHTSLRLPDDSDLWQRLASVYGIPAATGSADLIPADPVAEANEVLRQIHCSWEDDPPLEAIELAIAEGARRPGLPANLPVIDASSE